MSTIPSSGIPSSGMHSTENPTAADRRTFLRRGSRIMAAGAWSASLWGSLCGRSSNRHVRGAEAQNAAGANGGVLRIGVIGATGRGDYGHGVDVAFTKLPQAKIAALADADEGGRAEAQKRTQPERVYADYREMLAREKFDLVAICPRWVDQHHDMIVAAAEAGCHIYMEKPFCPTLAECDSAVAALAKRNLKLGIAHIAQYSPVLAMVQTLIDNDEIGEVLELRARGKEDPRGGAEDLWVLGSHVLAMMRLLAGANALSCSSVITQQGRKVTKADVVEGPEGLGPMAGDNIQARYAFPSGAFGHIASRRGMAASPSRFALQIYGSKGVIEMPSGYLAPAYLLRDGSWSPGRSGKAWEPITSAGVGKPEPRTDGSYEGGHLAAIHDLLDAVRQDRPTRCSAEDCRSVVEMISAVFESHRVGAEVSLPLATRVHPLTLLA